MSGVAGQGMRHMGRLLHRILRLTLVAVVLAAAGVGLLAWRLSLGPLDLPWLVPRLEAVAVGDGYRLAVDGAALAWEGAGDRVDRPVDLRLRGVALLDGSGERIMDVPSLQVSLSFLALLRGELRPRAIDVAGLQLRAWRRADGSAALDLTRADEPAPAAAGAVAAEGAGLLAAVLAELRQPANPLAAPRADGSAMLAALRRVRLRDATISVTDRQLDTVWHVRDANLDIWRRARGGLDGRAGMDLLLGGQTLPFSATASLAPEGEAGGIAFRFDLPPVVPATLAAAVPRLQPLAALDASLTLTLSGAMDVTLAPPQMRLSAEIGPGRLQLARGAMPLRGATLQAHGTLSEFDLQIVRLDVAPETGGAAGAASRVTGWLHGRRDGGQLQAALSLAVDRMDFADLPQIWPVGLGGPGLRPWMVENLTAGTVRNLHLGLVLRAGEDFSDLTVTHAQGGAEGSDVTLHWLRPVPPLEHGEARMTLLSPDALRIDVLSGRQALPARTGARAPESGLVVKEGHVVLSGLSVHDQFADIEGKIAGPLPEVLAVLNLPRIHLLDRRPITMRDPAGFADGSFSVIHLPLKEDLTLEELQIRAQAHLTGVHLGGVAAGRDLDRGTLDLEASNDGLMVRGEAALAGIPTKLRVDMDFRDGPASQVIQRVAVSGTADAAELAGLGLDAREVLSGPVGVQVDMASRRSGADEVAVKADLTAAGLAVDRLHWAKPPGQAAQGQARVLMTGGRVTAIEGLRAEGPGLDLRGRLEFSGGHPRLLQLDRLALGAPGAAPATEASGTVQWPAQPGGPWLASLSGPSLDAEGQFGRTGDEGAANADGPAWQVDGRFGRVLLGPGRQLAAVRAQVTSDGRVLRQARVSGSTVARAGNPAGAFTLSIVPQTGGRALSAEAADAGGLLRALGIVPDMLGGRMTLTGRYDDTAAGHPLTGSLRITEYRLHDAPVVAKLLQVVSVYGIVAALESRDMAFSDLVAPFRMTGDRVELFDARTFNASLGVTAKGTLDLARQVADVQGTIVPAYLLNSFLGRLPLIGKLLSPEQGGGLFAVSYWVNGPFADPSVGANPLSAVTPGFLRGMFGVFQSSPTPNGGAPAAPAPVPGPAPGLAPATPPAPGGDKPAPPKPPAAWGSGING